jgi:hypothetical protein
MPSKKYKLLLGLITLMTTTTFAQMGTGYSIYDSSVIKAKNMPQQNEFWNNTYNFPAKPRNMLEVGLSIGAPTVTGDVDGKFPTFGFGLHVRKAFGYIFSLRLQYLNGTAKGLSWQGSQNYLYNRAWIPVSQGGNLASGTYNPLVRLNDGTLTSQNGGKTTPVYYNYKAHIQDLSLQGIITLNNVRFHKQKTGFTVYGGAGIGFTAYHTMVNALNGNADYTVLFSTTQAQQGTLEYSNRKDILKKLKAGMDKTYETEAESEAGTRRGKLGKNSIRPSGTILAGVAFKLSNRVNLALEDRHTFIKSDLLDGQRWQEHAPGEPVLTSDYDSYNYLSLGVNFNLGAKSVEPLWWLNPLDYAYSEINNPKHMKLPKPILDDADGDGVTDQLDREPNTPAGCPVDSHGVTKDTDGDGVPDCKDKQLITPTDCQPVDADGVGKCPDPACCSDIKKMIEDGTLAKKNDCPTDYPSLTMKGVSLNADNKAMLTNVANQLKEKPTCTITVTAYPKADKRQQALADKKLEAVKNYLVEKLGISADRIATDKLIDGGDANTIDIK